MCMMYAVTMKKEIVSSKPCVKNGSSKVINYLLDKFGAQNLFFCRPGDKCMFVCPRENVPFEVHETIEFFENFGGFMKGIIDPGIYRISLHDQRETSHYLILEKYENQKWKEFAGLCGGWTNGLMIDWRGIRPVQIN